MLSKIGRSSWRARSSAVLTGSGTIVDDDEPTVAGAIAQCRQAQGQHTQAILQELGYARGQIDTLLQAGIVKQSNE